MSQERSRPQVAVVITCHNYGRFLAEAVESALAQSHAPERVVVIDDGSTDETPVIARSFGNRIHYHRQDRAGANAARNAGLSRAGRAEYVTFLDADDTLAPDYLEACLAALRADPDATYAYTQWSKFGDSTGDSHFPAWSLDRLLEKNFVHIAALIRTDVLRETTFDLSLTKGNMDWDLYLTLAGRGHRGVLIDRPLLQYRQHGTSIQDSLRRNPASRPLIAIRLAWKHRRLYGWRRLLERVALQVGVVVQDGLPWLLRKARLEVFATAGEVRRAARRQRSRMFPGR